MRRVLAGLLLACLLSASACAYAEDIGPMMGFDDESGRAWADSAFFVRMEQLTGVGVRDFAQGTERANYRTALDSALSGGSLPATLFKAQLTPQQELDGAASGALIDLAPLLDQYAPNLSALLAAHPDWRAAITLPDGKIVALPQLAEHERQAVIWINREWLKKLGLAMPATPEQYQAALIAMRDGDPNGNGKRDEIPLRLIGPWEAKWLASFFGLAMNDYNVYADEAGQVRFAPREPAFYDFLSYLRGLNEAGLLGEDAFTGTHAMQALEQADEKQVSVGGMISLAPYTLLPIAQAEQFDALPPMVYAGKTRYRDLQGSVWRGAFAVTSACKNPAAALSWVDALYAPEGAMLAWAGMEGEDYAFVDDGTWTYAITQERTLTDLQTKSLMSGGAAMPGLMPYEFWRRIGIAGERHVMAESDKVAQVATLPVPLVYWTNEQQAELDALQAALGPAVDRAIARFATGETELNEQTFAAFQQELDDLGAVRMTALWQTALDAKQ